MAEKKGTVKVHRFTGAGRPSAFGARESVAYNYQLSFSHIA